MAGQENRRATRYKTALPVEVGSEKCTSIDVSSSGIFFETDKSFSPGQPIEFTIVLENVDPAHPVRLQCRGAIVRVEDKGQKVGVAATISTYTFEKVKNDKTGKAPEKRSQDGRNVTRLGILNAKEAKF